MDRGYLARYTFSVLQSKGIHFIVRMKSNWLPVKEFLKSRKQDMTVMMEVPDGDFDRYRQHFPPGVVYFITGSCQKQAG